jgi:hypothetical protein
VFCRFFCCRFSIRLRKKLPRERLSSIIDITLYGSFENINKLEAGDGDSWDWLEHQNITTWTSHKYMMMIKLMFVFTQKFDV